MLRRSSSPPRTAGRPGSRRRSRSCARLPRLPVLPRRGWPSFASFAVSRRSAVTPREPAMVHGQRLSFGEIANEAAFSRLYAGTNYRSDIDAGFQIGGALGRRAVVRGLNDGSANVWNTSAQPGRPLGPAYWVPTPP